MAFLVKRFFGEPDYETLHVAKIVNFPLEPREYRPFSQVRICFSDASLQVQMLAFESEPLPKSAVHAVFCLGAGTPALHLGATADRLFDAAAENEALDASASFFTGEDLQGVYWGVLMTIPNAQWQKIAPDFRAEKGSAFTGNFYKICEDESRPHYGCYYPADFSKPLWAAENLGAFEVIEY